ncbi:VacJ family lipoprotein [Amaricoccus sp.]|uniref:MlaA family lipoprotein n=1 Tax=Amaricoccus sp. TaxID=1872485 RepID=UPI00261A6EEE|nr:VacJ family lipoprotein [uncultured Amaricoccus sp.]
MGGISAALLLSACAGGAGPNDLGYDPHVAQNRPVHETNMAIDKAVYGPVARAYGATVPAPVRHGITNLNDNWGLPGEVIQYGLQGNGMRAAEAGTRFLVNTLFGLGGLIDPATDMGLPYRDTGFDETFYAWGVPDGGYVELPLAGPGTERDWTSWALDIVADPVFYLAPVAATNALLGVATLDIVNDRYEIDPVLTEIVQNSADSYTALRISYLQAKQARLAGGTDVTKLEDVYDDY